jgi:hypothetical protein
MRTKLLIALAVVMAIVALTGFGGASVEAARAGVPRVPAPHVPHPEPRPPVHLPRPPGVHIPPGESFEYSSSSGYANSSAATRHGPR